MTERPPVPLRSIKDAKYVANLPDAGPWSLCVFGGRLFAASQISGVYEVLDTKVVKVTIIAGPGET